MIKKILPYAKDVCRLLQIRMRASGGKKNYFLFIIIAVIVLLLDQVSKWIVVNNIEAHQIISVFPGFFRFVLVKNRGIAFGILSKKMSGFFYYFLLKMVDCWAFPCFWRGFGQSCRPGSVGIRNRFFRLFLKRLPLARI